MSRNANSERMSESYRTLRRDVKRAAIARSAFGGCLQFRRVRNENCNQGSSALRLAWIDNNMEIRCSQ